MKKCIEYRNMQNRFRIRITCGTGGKMAVLTSTTSPCLHEFEIKPLACDFKKSWETLRLSQWGWGKTAQPSILIQRVGK
jgi:hypothetical protein